MGMNTLQRASIRATLTRRFGARCVYCGAKKNLTIEHRLPKVLGGTNAIKNLALACRTCNHRKGSMTEEQWLTWMRRHPRWLAERRLTLILEMFEELDTESSSSHT